jgi:hypothetical protein
MRKLIATLGLVSAVAAVAVPVATGSDYRGRYQLRLSETTTLLTPPPATR